MSNNANKYHLGLTGWSTKEWVGSFYRREVKLMVTFRNIPQYLTQ